MTDAILVLEDGTSFKGKSLGAEGESIGEVVFNTAMSGYQEILTDPSYKGQIVCMTCPQIGNYGVNKEDVESRALFLEGFIVREASSLHSNWRAQSTLDAYLKLNNIVGIQEIDTRELTRHIRDRGAQLGIISTIDINHKSLVDKVTKAPGLIGRDLVKDVTCSEPYTWDMLWDDNVLEYLKSNAVMPYNVIVYDFGVKYNILRKLCELGCKVTVVPASTPPDDILRGEYDGLLLSNGPGDPDAVTYAIDSVRELIGKIPIMGICLGHQILALASGCSTYKLKFGHHGANHPVRWEQTKEVEITSQNHGFCVDPESVQANDIDITHWNLYDKTVEGIHNLHKKCFSVQYHPESSPGPHDSHYLFRQFLTLMDEQNAQKK